MKFYGSWQTKTGLTSWFHAQTVFITIFIFKDPSQVSTVLWILQLTDKCLAVIHVDIQ